MRSLVEASGGRLITMQAPGLEGRRALPADHGQRADRREHLGAAQDPARDREQRAVSLRRQPHGAHAGRRATSSRRRAPSRRCSCSSTCRATRSRGTHDGLDARQSAPRAARASRASCSAVAIGLEVAFGIEPQVRARCRARPSAAFRPRRSCCRRSRPWAPEQAYPETVARPLFIPTRRPAPEAPVAAQGALQKGQFVLQGVDRRGRQPHRDAAREVDRQGHARRARQGRATASRSSRSRRKPVTLGRRQRRGKARR